MRILFDTHAWLWMISDAERLSSHVRALVQDGEHELHFSAVSACEIAIKYSRGKLRLPEPPSTFVPTRLERLRILSLPIQQAHALHVWTLPLHHRDPFDRLLIAQAQLENLQILTADSAFSAYDVRTIAAS